MHMTMYENFGVESNIMNYDIGDDFIVVKYFSGNIYRYSYQTAGKKRVERMKQLARKGHGLNRFIDEYAYEMHEK